MSNSSSSNVSTLRRPISGSRTGSTGVSSSGLSESKRLTSSPAKSTGNSPGREARALDVMLVGLRPQPRRVSGREDAGAVLELVAPARALVAAPGQERDA